MTFDVIAKHNANKQTRPKLTSLTEKNRLKHLSNFRFGGFEVVVGASRVYTPVSSCFLSNWPKLKPIFRSSFFTSFWFIEVFFSIKCDMQCVYWHGGSVCWPCVTQWETGNYTLIPIEFHMTNLSRLLDLAREPISAASLHRESLLTCAPSEGLILIIQKIETID